MRTFQPKDRQPTAVDSGDIAAGSLPALTAATPDAPAATSRRSTSRRNFMKSLSLAAVVAAVPTQSFAKPIEPMLKRLIDEHRRAFALIEAAGDEQCRCELIEELPIVRRQTESHYRSEGEKEQLQREYNKRAKESGLSAARRAFDDASNAEFHARLALVAYRPRSVGEADLKKAYIALSVPFTEKWCEDDMFAAALIEELCNATA